MSERHVWEPIPVDEAIEQLVDAASTGGETADLLTERQAQAFVLRDVEAVPRAEAAEQMGIGKSGLDNQLYRARRKVEAAEDLLETIDSIRHRPLPDECADCGGALGTTFSANDDGEPICLDCAGVDEAGRP